ncbi:MAG TPA: alpha/beta fold hydrolase [Acidimicrobiia bacterium]|nr:alpha/beta fold hydrolase [Acidimicrobiia bacterium]
MAVPTFDPTAPLHHRGTSGHAVVLLHGFTGQPGHWLPFAEDLMERGHSLVAPLLPGHGPGPERLIGHRLDDWVETAVEAAGSVADHGRLHLVGLSLGGLVAILAAGPTGATSLATVNSPVLVRDLRFYLAPVAHRLVPETLATQTEVPDPILAHLWSPWETQPTAGVAELVEGVVKALSAAGRLRRRALVVQSRNDEVVYPVSARILAARLRARLVWLSDTRHNTLLDPSRNRLHRILLRHLEAGTPPVTPPEFEEQLA